MSTPNPAPEPPVLAADPEPAPAAVEPSLPSIADGVERHLDPRAVTLDRIVSGIVTAAISLSQLVALVVIYFVADDLPGRSMALLVLFWVAFTLTLAWSSYRWPEVEHRHKSYKVDERGIEIRKGVYWRKVINVPRSRVQHTDVSQGPIERSFGLGTLVIYTAGTSHARVDLSGLEHATALRIRDHLLPEEASDAA
ncbi:MAG TPA: PH domain-containing protein [Thermoanaerobaculia bacterium]|nr:PH domain-containing protein [Thermoanaerobaculia bacterium]